MLPANSGANLASMRQEVTHTGIGAGLHAPGDRGIMRFDYGNGTHLEV